MVAMLFVMGRQHVLTKFVLQAHNMTKKIEFRFQACENDTENVVMDIILWVWVVRYNNIHLYDWVTQKKKKKKNEDNYQWAKVVITKKSFQWWSQFIWKWSQKWSCKTTSGQVPHTAMPTTLCSKHFVKYRYTWNPLLNILLNTTKAL